MAIEPQKVQYRMGSLQLKQIHIIQRGLHLSAYYHTIFVFLTCLLKKKFKSHFCLRFDLSCTSYLIPHCIQFLLLIQIVFL